MKDWRTKFPISELSWHPLSSSIDKVLWTQTCNQINLATLADLENHLLGTEQLNTLSLRQILALEVEIGLGDDEQ